MNRLDRGNSKLLSKVQAQADADSENMNSFCFDNVYYSILLALCGHGGGYGSTFKSGPLHLQSLLGTILEG